MNIIRFMYLVVFTFSSSVLAQSGTDEALDEKTILNLPVGTVMTLDGKNLSKIQKKCPHKTKKKMIIKGEEVELETSNLLFQDGDVKC